MAGSECNQMNAAQMDIALDARRRLALVSGAARCHAVMVAGVRARCLTGVAPGHRSPGDRTQRKRRCDYRADETSHPVFHSMNVAARLQQGKGSGKLPDDRLRSRLPHLPTSHQIPSVSNENLRERNPVDLCRCPS
jgi:hypothetical protein